MCFLFLLFNLNFICNPVLFQKVFIQLSAVFVFFLTLEGFFEIQHEVKMYMYQEPTVGPLNINAIKYLNTLIYVYIACAFSFAPAALTFNGEWI